MRTDLVVIGSGATGLSAAVTAAILGLSVVVIEKAPLLGGTSAWSGGWMWVPRNPLAVEAGIVESIEAPRAYLRAELGAAYDEAIVSMFLEQAPRMVAFLRQEAGLAFIAGNAMPDFHHRSDQAGRGGRSVCAAPYDGREMGKLLDRMRPPLDLVAPFGMGIASGADLQNFLDASTSLKSARHVAGRVTRHLRDMVTRRRGMHLVNGNALVGRLLKAGADHGVTYLTACPAEEILMQDGRVTGVRAGGRVIEATRGVVLAAGGFPHDPARQARLFPHQAHFSAAPRTNTGEGLRLGEQAGGEVRGDLSNAAAWAPVSLVPRGDGSFGHFPHLIERAKPGLIMVRRDGRRFGNEANSYHDLMQALFAATPAGEEPECWMICDHRFLRRYGLGRVRPFPFRVSPWIANGYLRRGRSLAALARASGIDAQGLMDTVTRFNQHAAAGEDPAFGRGEGPYNRIQGEARHTPNPCVAPLARAPFYALRIVVGSLGTFSGLRTDAQARVLGQDGAPIGGLFAVGNDMSSMMGGSYPAGGITLGPGMTFGYVAAHTAAGIPLDNNRMSSGEPSHAL
jgi:hypothetical protein